ncbi:MAG: DUF305 domain-containing protein [Ferruginibacter sp.]
MENNNMKNMESMMYRKFLLTLAVSFIIMYIIMFLNVIEVKHYHTSLTRIYMALLMISSMAVLMMLMMGKMYPNKKMNTGIIVGGLIVFILVLAGLRSQTPIGDVQYMKAMIPHHSSAILTSERADIKDPEVKKLADDIIKAQRKEIAEMETMLDRLDK